MKRAYGNKTADDDLPYLSAASDTLPDGIYQTIVDRMEQGVLVYDSHQIFAANEQLCEIMMVPPELVKPGSLLEDYISYGEERGDYKGSSGLTLAAMRMRIANGEDYVVERRLPNGKFIRVDCRHHGNIGVGTYTDITEAMREKAVLENTIEAMAQGLLVHDADEIIASNARLAEILQLPEKLIEPGQPWANIFKFRAKRGDYDDYEPYLEKIKRCLVLRGRFTVESVARDKTVRTEVRHAHGMLFVTFTDVTDAREREKRLERQEQEVRKLAETDSLTGLTNRRAFDEALPAKFAEKLLENKTRDLALFLIDLDHFKPVNDTYGHGFGDNLLQTLADRFRGELRPEDTIARIGGDEFAAIIDVADRNDAVEIAARLGNAARRPIVVEGVSLKIDASIGITYRSDGFASSEDMFVAADLALYAAKKEGRGSIREFEPEFAISAKQRYRLELDLEQALAKGELFLQYQPQFCVQSRDIVGYEALLRWQHSQRGLISPVDFIPLAEESGLIVDVGRWVLQRAMSDFAKLDQPCRVAINVSPVQFLKSNLIEDIKDALEISGLAPELLEIEITEDVLLSDDDQTLRILGQIRELGAGLSLDDFGSGYSSLGYLTKCPFSKLKIDKLFMDQMMHDERSLALVMSILSLAATMGMKVTAEGIETEEQLAQLLEGKCDEAQGYLLGRPQHYSDILPNYHKD